MAPPRTSRARGETAAGRTGVSFCEPGRERKERQGQVCCGRTMTGRRRQDVGRDALPSKRELEREVLSVQEVRGVRRIAAITGGGAQHQHQLHLKLSASPSQLRLKLKSKARWGANAPARLLWGSSACTLLVIARRASSNSRCRSWPHERFNSS